MNRPQISIPRWVLKRLYQRLGSHRHAWARAFLSAGAREGRAPPGFETEFGLSLEQASVGQDVGDKAMLSGSRAQGEGDLSEGVEKGERVRQMQHHAAHRAHDVGAQLQQSLAQHPDLRPRHRRACR